MDKKVGPTRTKLLALKAKNRLSRKRDPEPEPLAADGEEDLGEENTGELELTFSLVEPEEVQARTDDFPTAPEPGPTSEPEPEFQGPRLEPEPEHEPGFELREGKLGVLIVRCDRILTAKKKKHSKVFVTMSLGTSAGDTCTHSTDTVESSDLDPIFGNSHLHIFEVQGAESILSLRLYSRAAKGPQVFLGACDIHLSRDEVQQQLAADGSFKIGFDRRLEKASKYGEMVPQAILKLKSNAERINTPDPFGKIELKLEFIPNKRGSGATSSSARATVQLGTLGTPKRAPGQEGQIRRLFETASQPAPEPKADEFEPEPEVPSAPDETLTEPDVDGKILQNCRVELLLLGARELVTKPRKAKICVEYWVKDHTEPSGSGFFRILDNSQNPSFTAARSELERKSIGKLRKMFEESTQTIITDTDLKKDQLVRQLLEISHLTMDGVPFVRSKKTSIKIKLMEQPFMRRARGAPTELGSATIQLYTDINQAVDMQDVDANAAQHWKDACEQYILGIRTLCESSRVNPAIRYEHVREHPKYLFLG